VEQIEDAVRGLFCDELAAFPRRFAEFDGVLWDRQIEEEVAAGSEGHPATGARIAPDAAATST
jgi:hypothetical protein